MFKFFDMIHKSCNSIINYFYQKKVINVINDYKAEKCAKLNHSF